MEIDETIQKIESINLSNNIHSGNTINKNQEMSKGDILTFPSPSPPKNPFLPDPYCLAYDKLNIEYFTEVGENGRLFTNKALKNPTSTLKKLIESEKNQHDSNTSRHTYTKPDITFDAYVKLDDIIEY